MPIRFNNNTFRGHTLRRMPCGYYKCTDTEGVAEVAEVYTKAEVVEMVRVLAHDIKTELRLRREAD